MNEDWRHQPPHLALEDFWQTRPGGAPGNEVPDEQPLNRPEILAHAGQNENRDADDHQRKSQRPEPVGGWRLKEMPPFLLFLAIASLAFLGLGAPVSRLPGLGAVLRIGGIAAELGQQPLRVLDLILVRHPNAPSLRGLELELRLDLPDIEKIRKRAGGLFLRQVAD